MKNTTRLLAFAVVSIVAASLGHSADYNIPQELLVKGDYSQQEVLRYRRIRVERQEVIFGDTQPMLCRQGSTILVAGRGGALARSTDGGVTWEPLDGLKEPTDNNGDLQALGSISGGTVLAAVRRDSNITFYASQDEGQTWQTGGDVTLPSSPSDLRGRFLQLGNQSVLFSVDDRIFRSADSGKSWSEHATLPEGLSALRATQLKSGKLLAAALYEGDGSGEYRNTVIAESGDDGKSWNIVAAATRIGQVPGDLVELSDGRLVLSYGEESFPYGARALVSSDGGKTWGKETYVVGMSRYGLLLQPRPEACEPASGSASIVLEDGVIISAYDRGKTLKRHAEPGDGRTVDEWGHQAAIGIMRWTPDGFERPPLVYPEMLTDRVDAEGYLDTGLVRIRPDDRFEGGDFIENYETIVYRRLPGEQLTFAGIGGKGVVVCRHPDGSLLFTCRFPEIYRSTDEGRSWSKWADIDRPTSHDSSTSGFGVTNKGTLLAMVDVKVAEENRATGARNVYKMHIGRSTDDGKTWDFRQVDPGPKHFGGRGDGSRINQLSNGTIVLNSATAWVHPSREFNLGEVILRSQDDGQTWGDFSVLPPHTCESNLLELPSGRLLLATRFQQLGELHYHYFSEPTGEERWLPPSRNYVGEPRYKNEAIMFSDDGGYNWTKPFLVTRIHMVSADVVRDPKGRVVLTYDHKDAIGGCRARVSTDEGETWEEENYILSYARIGQRTSSVVLKDGRILTLWASAVPRNGVSATIWSPE